MSKAFIFNTINAIPNSYVSKVNKAKQEFVKAAEAEVKRFSTQVALYESGMYSEYHKILTDSTNIASYKLNTTTATIKLGQEGYVLNKIVAVITDLKGKIADIRIAGGTNIDKANSALSEIQKLVNTKTANGAYLLAGVDTLNPPCNDLVAISNLDANDNVTTNYTTSTLNQTRVQVSELGVVTVGNLYAGMAGIAQAIGAMNMLKAPVPNLVKIDETLNQATTLIGQAIAVNGIEQDKIKVAIEDNNSLLKQNDKTLIEVFQRSIPEISSDIKNAADNYGIALKVLKLQLNTLQKIFDIS
jgi:hypothetical protein